MKDEPEGEPDELTTIAEAIADGVPVAWDEVDQRATGAETAATLEKLRDLERIAAAQRQIGVEHDHTVDAGTGRTREGPGPPDKG